MKETREYSYWLILYQESRQHWDGVEWSLMHHENIDRRGRNNDKAREVEDRQEMRDLDKTRSHWLPHAGVGFLGYPRSDPLKYEYNELSYRSQFSPSFYHFLILPIHYFPPSY